MKDQNVSFREKIKLGQFRSMETPKKWQVGYPKNRMSHRVQLQPSIWSAAALLQSTPFIKIHVGNPKPPKPQGGAPPPIINGL